MDLCVLLFSLSLCDQFNVKIADRNAPSSDRDRSIGPVFSYRRRRGYFQRGKATVHGQEMRKSHRDWPTGVPFRHVHGAA